MADGVPRILLCGRPERAGKLEREIAAGQQEARHAHKKNARDVGNIKETPPAGRNSKPRQFCSAALRRRVEFGKTLE